MRALALAPLVVVLTLHVVDARAEGAPPVRVAQLLKTLPKKGSARGDGLRAFAESDAPAMSERVRAATLLQKEAKAASPDDRLSHALLLARLYGVAGDTQKRTRALAEAKRLAKGKRATDLALVTDADLALARVKRGLAKRTIEPDDLALLKKAGLTARTLDDEPRAAQYELIALLGADALGKLPFEKTNKLLRAGGEHRDLADVRVAVRRLRARHLAGQGRWTDAVHESLVADRARRPSPKLAASAMRAGAYRRSKESAKLCFEARAHDVNCAHLEEERMGERTFYDFSGERIARFSSDANDAVMAEYDELLKRCVHIDTDLSALDSRIELEWTVSPKGTVETFTVVKPRFLQTGPFQKCAEEAFARVRYPRFRGPPATVQMELSI